MQRPDVGICYILLQLSAKTQISIKRQKWQWENKTITRPYATV